MPCCTRLTTLSVRPPPINATATATATAPLASHCACILRELPLLLRAENGYCTAADVDNFAKMAFGPRMSVTGVIEQKDLSGLVTHAASQRGIVPHLHHGVSPAKFVQEMPDKGKLGAASGQGFYDWTERDVAAARAQASVLTEAVLQVTRGKVGGPPLSKI
jgi:3-hydroxyacyl-CoA dehydrogenase